MILEANNISFAYRQGQTVLHDVSLELNEGEILFIIGKNGCGKTTLLSCLCGLLNPQTGNILIEGKPLINLSSAERAQNIGLIPQMHAPTFAYTVNQMVMMGRAAHLSWMGSPSTRDHEIVIESLEQVGLTDLRDRPYTEISGGEQQLVLIARGLTQRCPVLLMDEPTAHLDLSNQHRVLEIVHQLGRQGLSFIISSHAPNDALAYADYVMLLSGGWVTDYGKPQEILSEPLLSSVFGIQTEVIYQSENGQQKARAVIPRRPLSIKAESINLPDSLLRRFFNKRKQAPQLIIVTGLSGVGKTTWCSQLVEHARSQGYKVEGILSPGIFEGKQKTGIAALNLANNERRALARLHKNDRGELTTPRWVFYPEALEWANQALQNGCGSDLLIIDELGPLEFLREKGLIAGIDRIDKKEYQVACVVIRSSLLPKALQRWPDAHVVSGSI